MANKNFVSINELAKTSNINKSKLNYYMSLGLIVPETVVGRMYIFDKKTTINALKRIQALQSEGLSLKQIKERLSRPYDKFYKLPKLPKSKSPNIVQSSDPHNIKNVKEYLKK